MDWRSNVGRPRYLVLYRTTTRWRFAIYTTGGVADGSLDTSLATPAEQAQRDLSLRAEGIAGEPLVITWQASKPDWWTGEVVQ